MILLRLFKNNRTAGIAFLFLLALILVSGAMITGLQPVAHEGMPFYQLIFGSIHEYPILNRIITLALVYSLVFMLTRIGVRNILLEFRSYMPAIFFMLFSLAHPSLQQVSPALAGSIFYLLSFAILFEAHDKKPDTYSIFHAGLILALGSMFCLKLIWFIPVMWISLGTLRPVTWRELVYPLIAYALLALFLFTWYWVGMDSGKSFVEILGSNLIFRGAFRGVFTSTDLHFSVLLCYGFYLLLIIIASFYMINSFQARKTVVQNIYQVLFYMFVAGILFFLFIEGRDLSSLVFMAFPVAFIMANYFHRKRNHWLHEIILWILVGLIAYSQVMALG